MQEGKKERKKGGLIHPLFIQHRDSSTHSWIRLKRAVRGPLAPSYAPPVTRIPARRLALPDNLHHLALPQTEVLGHGIPDLDPGQLALLQAVALQQLDLLLGAQELVRGHELVVRDVDQQVLLLERLDDVRLDGGDDLERGGGDGGLRDEDARVELVLVDVLGEGAHLLDADAGVGAEFDPDGADLRERGRVGFRGESGVFGEHGVGGFEGGVHFLAAAVGGLVASVPWELFFGGGGGGCGEGQTQGHRWGRRRFCETRRAIC